MLYNLLLIRLLKKLQMEGGEPGTHPKGWIPQMGLFQGLLGMLAGLSEHRMASFPGWGARLARRRP